MSDQIVPYNPNAAYYNYSQPPAGKPDSNNFANNFGDMFAGFLKNVTGLNQGFNGFNASNGMGQIVQQAHDQNQGLLDLQHNLKSQDAMKSELRMNDMFRIQQEQMHNAQLRKQQSDTNETIGATFSKGAEKAKELASR